MDVGIEGEEGTDRFTISVCNEGRMLDLIYRVHDHYDFAEINHVLIFKEFDEQMIVGKPLLIRVLIKLIIRRCPVET